MSQVEKDTSASPFPGMDPYLEASPYWRSFHHHLAEEIVRSLNPRITPKYFADVELHNASQELIISETPPRLHPDKEHIYPDVAIVKNPTQSSAGGMPIALASAAKTDAAALTAPIERVVELSEPETLRTVKIYQTENKKLVTAIELLSPANKTGEGLIKYQRKRTNIISSDVNLIEIDLLRGGQRPGPEVNLPTIDTDYIILCNSNDENVYRISKIWPVALNEPLPMIPVALRATDPAVPLDLTEIFHTIYETNYYGLRIDYSQSIPPPKLRSEMARWGGE